MPKRKPQGQIAFWSAPRKCGGLMESSLDEVYETAEARERLAVARDVQETRADGQTVEATAWRTVASREMQTRMLVSDAGLPVEVAVCLKCGEVEDACRCRQTMEQREQAGSNYHNPLGTNIEGFQV